MKKCAKGTNKTRCQLNFQIAESKWERERTTTGLKTFREANAARNEIRRDIARNEMQQNMEKIVPTNPDLKG